MKKSCWDCSYLLNDIDPDYDDVFTCEKRFKLMLDMDKPDECNCYKGV